MKLISLFTIGYEGLNVARFFEILQSHEIEHLIDVRAVALSRKAGFSKTALSLACHNAGIEYSHHAALGCPNDIRASYRVTSDWQEYSRGFLSYLATRQDDVRTIWKLSQQQRCALLCFEADASFCHRIYVAKAAQKLSRGAMAVHHLTQTSIPLEEQALVGTGK